MRHSRALSLTSGFALVQGALAKVDKYITILAIHIDDCILTRSSPELIAGYKNKFNDRYTLQLTDLGSVHWFLGIKITRDRSARTISLSQTSYIDSILTHFGLGDAKLAAPTYNSKRDALYTLACSTLLPCPTLLLMDDASHLTYRYG